MDTPLLKEIPREGIKAKPEPVLIASHTLISLPKMWLK